MSATHRLASSSRLRKEYEQNVVPALQKELGIPNTFALPKVEKIVLNVGFGREGDSKKQAVILETLSAITGQKPLITKAKKSISNFKVRQGMEIGAKVTLRGPRMYDFLDRLVNITLPRVRDFHGLPLSGFDRQGNYTLGLREHTVFPEIRADQIEMLHGVEITICTTADSPQHAEMLLRRLGLPLQQSS